MSNVKNNSRDYIIEKLDFRVRYDTDVNKVPKIIKKINEQLQKIPELGPVLLDKIKSQGVRELDDSAMIMRVKFKTIPGEQFVVRREVFRMMPSKNHYHKRKFLGEMFKNLSTYRLIGCNYNSTKKFGL
jgi:small-conductance mechanosensitive channel